MSRYRSDRFKAQILDYDFVFGKADDDDFAICLSWRERQALLTIIDVLAWPTRWVSDTSTVDTDAIEQLRNQIAYKLMGQCPVDCDEVVACIVADMDGEGDFFAALLLWLLEQMRNNSTVIDIMGGQEDTGTSLDIADDDMTTGITCNPDNAFGFANQLVELMHMLVMDMYQVIEVATNALEAFAALSDNVPILTTVTDFAEYAQDNLQENYEANWDVALKNELACGLYCLMLRNDCTLSWEDVFDFYMQQGFGGFSGTTISDWLSYLILGFWDGDEYVTLSHLTLAFALKVGGDWFGVKLQDVQRLVESYLNDPDEDWDILCDTCAPWVATFDFTVDDCGFTPAQSEGEQGQGTYVADTGWSYTDEVHEGTYRRSASIGLDVTAFNMHEMTLVFNLTKSVDYVNSDAERIYRNSTILRAIKFNDAVNGDDQEINKANLLGWEDVTNLSMYIRSHYTVAAGYGGNVLLTELRVQGWGDIPQEILDNCTDWEYI